MTRRLHIQPDRLDVEAAYGISGGGEMAGDASLLHIQYRKRPHYPGATGCCAAVALPLQIGTPVRHRGSMPGMDGARPSRVLR